MSELIYPVMMIGPKFILGRLKDERALHVVAESKFDAGCFDETVIIDAKGSKYRVISAEKRNHPDRGLIYWMKRRFWWTEDLVWAELNLQHQEMLQFEAVRSEVTNIILDNPKWWKRHFNYKEKELSDYLNKPTTLGEFINLIEIFN